jgi:hypothetical protein
VLARDGDVARLMMQRRSAQFDAWLEPPPPGSAQPGRAQAD